MKYGKLALQFILGLVMLFVACTGLTVFLVAPFLSVPKGHPIPIGTQIACVAAVLLLSALLVLLERFLRKHGFSTILLRVPIYGKHIFTLCLYLFTLYWSGLRIGVDTLWKLLTFASFCIPSIFSPRFKWSDE